MPDWLCSKGMIGDPKNKNTGACPDAVQRRLCGGIAPDARLVVERTFAWLGRYRRLSKDYEQRPEYSETWVYIASIARMLRTLHPNQNQEPPYKRKKRTTVEEGTIPMYA